MVEHDGSGEIGGLVRLRDFGSVTLEEVLEDSLCVLSKRSSHGQVIRVLNVLNIARGYMSDELYGVYRARYKSIVESKDVRLGWVDVLEGHGD